MLNHDKESIRAMTTSLPVLLREGRQDSLQKTLSRLYFLASQHCLEAEDELSEFNLPLFVIQHLAELVGFNTNKSDIKSLIPSTFSQETLLDILRCLHIYLEWHATHVVIHKHKQPVPKDWVLQFIEHTRYLRSWNSKQDPRFTYEIEGILENCKLYKTEFTLSSYFIEFCKGAGASFTKNGFGIIEFIKFLTHHIPAENDYILKARILRYFQYSIQKFAFEGEKAEAFAQFRSFLDYSHKKISLNENWHFFYAYIEVCETLIKLNPLDQIKMEALQCLSALQPALETKKLSALSDLPNLGTHEIRYGSNWRVWIKLVECLSDLQFHPHPFIAGHADTLKTGYLNKLGSNKESVAQAFLLPDLAETLLNDITQRNERRRYWVTLTDYLTHSLHLPIPTASRFFTPVVAQTTSNPLQQLSQDTGLSWRTYPATEGTPHETVRAKLQAFKNMDDAQAFLASKLQRHFSHCLPQVTIRLHQNQPYDVCIPSDSLKRRPSSPGLSP